MQVKIIMAFEFGNSEKRMLWGGWASYELDAVSVFTLDGRDERNELVVLG